MISAVDSARPSITPTATMLAPRPLTRKTGSRLWIISEETSISRLTKPSAQMLAGSREAARSIAASGEGDGGSRAARGDAADLVHLLARLAQRRGDVGGFRRRGHHHH